MKKYIGFLIILSVLVIGATKARAQVSTCAETTITEASLGVTGKTGPWERLGLDVSSHPEILRYRILWFSGNWSPWYVPGVGDEDSINNLDGTFRRIWSYFDDHNHQYVKCADGSIPTSYLNLISPKSGDTFQAGQSFNVSWESNLSAQGNFEVTVSRQNLNGSFSFVKTVRIPASSNTYTVQIPSITPAGEYKIDYGYILFDTYKSYGTATIYVTSSSVSSPVISGVSGPQSLNVNQVGTWTVNASDPNSGNLYYSVNWGDEPVACSTISGTSCARAVSMPQQSATFTHSYAQAGNYNPTFIVKNDSGQNATTSLSVNVNGIVSTPSITVLSPNGGETFTAGQQVTVKWASHNIIGNVNVSLIQPYSNSGFYAWVFGNSYLNSGQGTFTLPTISDWGNMIYGKKFKIFVGNTQSQGNMNIFDSSDNLFTINSATTVTKCADSDGGINLDVAGFTDDRVNGIGTTFNDESVGKNGGICSGNSCTGVAEGYCRNNQVTNKVFQCPSGHSVNGACVPISVYQNLPAGCTSTIGFSPLTGVKCDTSIVPTLPAGCLPGYNFSPITGVACNGITVSPVYPPGCNSNVGFSYITGESCNNTVVTTPVSTTGINYDGFATCLKNQGATFYGTYWCPHCQSQKQLFGSSASLLPYVECSTSDGIGQTQICQSKNITSYPTWTFADGTSLTGETPLSTLAQKTSCALPQ